MFGLAIVASALALWGAPASLPVSCNPVDTAAHQAYGLTWFVPGTTSPVSIEFAPTVCAGLTYLAASPTERAELRSLNPGVDFDKDAGVALLVVLHETQHATGDRDEALTECRALSQLASFAAQVAPADELSLMVAWGRSYDAALPASYHGASC